MNCERSCPISDSCCTGNILPVLCRTCQARQYCCLRDPTNSRDWEKLRARDETRTEGAIRHSTSCDIVLLQASNCSSFVSSLSLRSSSSHVMFVSFPTSSNPWRRNYCTVRETFRRTDAPELANGETGWPDSSLLQPLTGLRLHTKSQSQVRFLRRRYPSAAPMLSKERLTHQYIHTRKMSPTVCGTILTLSAGTNLQSNSQPC